MFLLSTVRKKDRESSVNKEREKLSKEKKKLKEERKKENSVPGLSSRSDLTSP